MRNRLLVATAAVLMILVIVSGCGEVPAQSSATPPFKLVSGTQTESGPAETEVILFVDNKAVLFLGDDLTQPETTFDLETMVWRDINPAAALSLNASAKHVLENLGYAPDVDGSLDSRRLRQVLRSASTISGDANGFTLDIPTHPVLLTVSAIEVIEADEEQTQLVRDVTLLGLTHLMVVDPQMAYLVFLDLTYAMEERGVFPCSYDFDMKRNDETLSSSSWTRIEPMTQDEVDVARSALLEHPPVAE